MFHDCSPVTSRSTRFVFSPQLPSELLPYLLLQAAAEVHTQWQAISTKQQNVFW